MYRVNMYAFSNCSLQRNTLQNAMHANAPATYSYIYCFRNLMRARNHKQLTKLKTLPTSYRYGVQIQRASVATWLRITASVTDNQICLSYTLILAVTKRKIIVDVEWNQVVCVHACFSHIRRVFWPHFYWESKIKRGQYIFMSISRQVVSCFHEAETVEHAYNFFSKSSQY